MIIRVTSFIGQAKRGLALVGSAAPLAAGAELISGDAKVGTVVSAIGDTALAVVSLDLQNTALQMNESPAASEASWDTPSWSMLPLHAGLAR